MLDGIPALPPADGPSSEVIDVTPGSHSEAAGRLLGRGSMPIHTAIHRVAERGARRTQDLHAGCNYRQNLAAEGRGQEAREQACFQSTRRLPNFSPSPARRARAQAWTELSSSRPTLAIQQPAATQPIAVCGARMLRRADALLISATALTLGYLFLRRRRRAAAASLPHAQVDARGFLVVQAAAAPDKVARMRAAIEAEASKAEAGGYLIWTPAESLPSVCREWAEMEAAAILQRALPAGTPAVRLLGGAALWKRVGVHDGTPFHQDFAYAEGVSAGSSASRATRHVAVWLALTPTGPRSGCLRFAPALGYELQPHQTLPRADAPSGFETHMVGPSMERAEAAAEDVLLEPGVAVIIGDQVVHGSYGGKRAESDRLAFSPLFEVDCVGCPLPAGRPRV